LKGFEKDDSDQLPEFVAHPFMSGYNGDAMENDVKRARRDYFLPASILIAALLVSLALVYNAGRGDSQGQLAGNLESAVLPAPDRVRPIDDGDHVLGDPNAPVKFISFTDLECPFCREFHTVLKQVVDDYEQVMLVYRHSPIDSLHSRARQEARASECAAELGGNDAFWRYVDRIFEITPSNNGLDPQKLFETAAFIGLNQDEFSSCLASDRHVDRVERDSKDALNAGSEGSTPYSVILLPSGKVYALPGYLPYEDARPDYPSMKAILNIIFEEEGL